MSDEILSQSGQAGRQLEDLREKVWMAAAGTGRYEA